MKKQVIEIACGSYSDCITASKADIDRIELNSALECGGLTPSRGNFILAKTLNIPLVVMIRPRAGGFNYNEYEFDVILKDAEYYAKNGAQGLVFGFLNEDGTLSIERTKKLVEICNKYNIESIISKAIDCAIDIDIAVEQLIDLGVNRILTTAGMVDAGTNSDKIQRLYELYGDDIEILVGGGVRVNNIEKVMSTGINQIHMSTKHLIEDGSTSKSEYGIKNDTFYATDIEHLHECVNKIREVERNAKK